MALSVAGLRNSQKSSVSVRSLADGVPPKATAVDAYYSGVRTARILFSCRVRSIALGIGKERIIAVLGFRIRSAATITQSEIRLI